MMLTKAQHAVALRIFDEYFSKNYPGPNTIIANPHWHAPKILRAAEYAIEAALCDIKEASAVDGGEKR
jgi:hypothetical protein